ncbi:Gfo/Idh/MocA family oxidoreductase [Amylibacter sp.]|nr:Gfo/Idh/MocA family oxidoreductase [Amylibacter sp.]
MDILIIGYSSIVVRRVVPALLRIEAVRKIHIATGKVDLEVDIPSERKGDIVKGYETALNQIPPCLAYVSLPNHLHAHWVKRALNKGFHVVVDKPAFLSESDLNDALSIAESQGLCLAEAVVWPFHDQVATLRETISLRGTKIRAMHGVFSMPPLPASNFRNNPDYGGGAFNDLAAYAVTPGRIFFEESPLEIRCGSLTQNELTGVNTGFWFDSLFSGSRIFQGFFSFTTEYRNSLLLLGDEFSAEVNPIFTIGPMDITTINIRSCNESTQLEVPSCDMFHIFLEQIILSVNLGDFGKWWNILRQDSFNYFRAARMLEGIE